jgi:hypothetical protein
MINAQKNKISVGFGAELSQYEIPNINGLWSKINPNFIEPDLLDTSYKSYNGTRFSSNVKLNYSIQLVNQIKESKFSFAPRFNISYGQGLASYNIWNKSESFIYDTLTSSSTGEKFYLDSTVETGRYFSVYSKAICLKLGLILDYQISNSFAFYTGLEFGLAHHFSINQENNTYQNYNKRFFENSNYYSSYNSISNENISYNKYNASFYPIKVSQFILGIPVGVKFRLSKKENIFQHFLISYEYNFNQSFFKIRSNINDKQELAKLQQMQHSHFLRLIYEL